MSYSITTSGVRVMFELNGIMHCDHCGQPDIECQKQSRIFGVCKDYNSLADDKETMRVLSHEEKPVGFTDLEARNLSTMKEGM